MTKTLKDFLEVYKPKSPDEQKFVDKHVTIKHKDRNGNGDDVFKGNTKYIKRKEERHGYDVGEDEKVYEEVEEIDEISKATMGRYINKAKDQIDAASWRSGYRQAKPNDPNSQAIINAKEKQLSKRHGGIELAVKKLTKEDADLDEVLDEAINLLMSIDEKTLTPAEMKKREEVVKAIKKGNPKMDKSIAYAIATKTAKKVAESSDAYGKSIDDIKKKNITSSDRDKLSRLHSMLSAEKKPVKEEIDDDLEAELKAQRQTKKSVADAKKKYGVKEEAEQIDELSTKKLSDYTAAASDARRHRGMPTAKLDKRYKGVMRAGDKINKGFSKVHATEEVEDLEELSKGTLASYAKKAANQSFGKGVAGGAALASSDKETEAQGHKLVTKAAKRMTGVQKAIGKLAKEDIINRAIDKYVPEEMKFTPEERLLKRLEGLSESHVNTLFGLFEQLNSDNQTKMLHTCETIEGINSLLDFALQNRGE